jgi:hypothetical protein
MNKRIALVGPSFFSYLESIASELHRRGIFSMHLDERHSNQVMAKIMYRIGFHHIFTRTKKKHLAFLYDQIITKNISDVLLVDVEVCDRDFVKKLINANINVGIYMWDSAKNKPNFLDYLDLLKAKSSFDPGDCESLGLKYIPLFAEFGASSRVKNSTKNIDIYFCGTLHSNRPKILNQVSKFSKANNLKFISYNYYHSKLLYLIKSLLAPSDLRIFKTITNKPLQKSEIYASMASAKYVLDIQHSGQRGLTARTFEALRSGAHLITTNDFAECLPHGLEKRIKIFKSTADLKNITFTNFSSTELTNDQDYYLSINRFVDDIVRLMSINLD